MEEEGLGRAEGSFRRGDFSEFVSNLRDKRGKSPLPEFDGI